MSEHNGTNGQAKRRLLRNPTAAYRGGAAWWGYQTSAIDGAPYFTWFDIPRMLRDPQVRFVERMWRAPFQRVKWLVRCERPEVARFVGTTLRRFWRNSLPKLLSRYFRYGYAPGGAEFALRKGRVRLDRVRCVEPADATPHVWTHGPDAGKPAGFTFAANGAALAEAPGAATWVPAGHAFWFSGYGEFSPWYDMPPLAGLFEPWVEKRGRNGAIHIRRQWFRKCAFRGGKLYHPPGTTNMGTDESPREMDNADIARQTLEYGESGAVYTFTNEMNSADNGKYAWDYEEPSAQPDVAGVREYPQDLDREMFVGAGIPPEVLEAAEVGSGWSGRLIPLMGFLGGVDELAGLAIEAADVGWLRGLVKANFGSVWYEIEPQSLAEEVQKQAQAGKGVGEGENPVPGLFADPDGQEMSTFDESKVNRDHGKFASSPGGAGAGTAEADGPEADPIDGRVRRIARALRGLPKRAVKKARAKVNDTYRKLEARYGPGYAKVIVGAGVASLPVPVPGAAVAFAAPILAVAELHRRLARWAAPPPETIDVQGVVKPASRWFLARVFGRLRGALHLSDGRGDPFAAGVPDGPPEPVRKFSAVLVPLRGRVAETLLAMGRRVRDEDLAEDGRELDPHVTVRSGLHGDDPEAARKVLAGAGPVAMKFGGVSVFPGAASGKDYDVLKVDVLSPGLEALHARLGALPHTDTHADYRPHATIAYVRAGLGEGYANAIGYPRTWGDAAAEVVFGDAAGGRATIPLAGEPVKLSTMFDRSDFEKRIDENPHEATHHLAYADFLDEEGDDGDEAAFRRAMGDWIETRRGVDHDGPTSDGRKLHRFAFHVSPGEQFTHSVWRKYLPDWAAGKDAIPVADSSREYTTRAAAEPHLAYSPNPFWLHWKGYRPLEAALRRSFKAHQERQRKAADPPPGPDDIDHNAAKLSTLADARSDDDLPFAEEIPDDPHSLADGRVTDPDAHLKFGDFDAGDHLFPEERAKLDGPRQADNRADYRRMVQAGAANRPRKLPGVDELKGLATLGDPVKGSYEDAHKTVLHLLGDHADAHRWVTANAVLSAQTGWEDHTAGATEALAAWHAAGRPTRQADLDHLFGRTARVDPAAWAKAGRPTDPASLAKYAGGTSVIVERGKPLVTRGGAVHFKGPDTLTGPKADAIKSLFSSHDDPGVGWGDISEGSLKTPNFGRAFVDPRGVPIDTHMAKLTVPTDGSPHFTHADAREVAERGKVGRRTAADLLEAQKKIAAHPASALAYKTLVAKAAADLGWEPRQVQEAVWTAALAVAAAKQRGASNKSASIIARLNRKAIQAGWSLHTVLSHPGVLRDLARLEVPARRLAAAVAASRKRLPKTDGRPGTEYPAALESVAARLAPEVHKAARPIAALLSDGRQDPGAAGEYNTGEPHGLSTPAPQSPHPDVPPIPPPAKRAVVLGDAPLPRSKARIAAGPTDAYHGPKTAAFVHALFGGATPRESHEHLAEALGLPDDAKLRLHPHGDYEPAFSDDGEMPGAHGVRVKAEHPKLHEASRFVGVDAEGKRFVRNEILIVKAEHQGEGLASDVLARQAEHASAHGFDYLHTHAAGDAESAYHYPLEEARKVWPDVRTREDVYAKPGGKELWARHAGMNGYVTWPKLGYDQSLTDPSIAEHEHRYGSGEVFEKARRAFPHAKTVLDIMESPGGPEWWEQNGTDLHNARFDLTPGSRSMRYLKARRQSRAAKSRPKAATPGTTKTTTSAPTSSKNSTPGTPSTSGNSPGSESGKAGDGPRALSDGRAEPGKSSADKYGPRPPFTDEHGPHPHEMPPDLGGGGDPA